MILDMSDVLEEFEQTVQLKTQTITTIDFEPVKVVTVNPIEAVVQVADKEKLSLDSLNWSKQYIWVHTSETIDIGQFIEWHGKDFKLVAAGDDYSDYGYTAFYGEETLEPLLVAT